jgi:hypothetical protein
VPRAVVQLTVGQYDDSVREPDRSAATLRGEIAWGLRTSVTGCAEVVNAPRNIQHELRLEFRTHRSSVTLGFAEAAA